MSCFSFYFFSGMSNNLLEKICTYLAGDYCLVSSSSSQDTDFFDMSYNFFSVPQKLYDALLGHEQVTSIHPRLDFTGQVSTENLVFGAKFMAFDFNRESEFMANFKITQGSPFDSHTGENQILVSSLYEEKYHIDIGQYLILTVRKPDGSLSEEEFTVKGVFSSIFVSEILNRYFLVRPDDINRFLQLNGKVSRLNIHLKQANMDFNEMINLVNQDYPEINIIFWKEGAGIFLNIYFILLLTFICFIIAAALIIAITTSISTAMVIEERRIEIATLQAVGARKSKVLMLMLFENIFLAALFSIIGFLASLVILFITRITGIFIPDKNIAFMIGGEIFYPAWTPFVLLVGIVWPIIVSALAAAGTTASGIKASISKLLNE
jgi:ABC-type lipoprotein release transport system permease subunit